MKAWFPLGLIAAAFSRGGEPRAEKLRAADASTRWRRAFRADPEIATDLIELGRVLQTLPTRFEGGVEQSDPIDPLRLAYEQGQRDLALRLLALGRIGEKDLNSLMEQTDE